MHFVHTRTRIHFGKWGVPRGVTQAGMPQGKRDQPSYSGTRGVSTRAAASRIRARRANMYTVVQRYNRQQQAALLVQQQQHTTAAAPAPTLLLAVWAHLHIHVLPDLVIICDGIVETTHRRASCFTCSQS